MDYLSAKNDFLEWPKPQVTQDYGVSIIYYLSNEILIQKRVVYDAFMMFGDVGGLYDFFNLVLCSMVGFFS